MNPVGTITVGPDSGAGDIAVGSFSLNEGDDTLWVEVQRTSPDQGWPWSYGILSWRTAFGNELGSIKAYAAKAGEVYKLSVSRAPRSSTGTIYYEPRSFNLAWIKQGYDLTLAFSAASGVAAAVPASWGSVAFPVVGGAWRYAANSGLMQLDL